MPSATSKISFKWSTPCWLSILAIKAMSGLPNFCKSFFTAKTSSFFRTKDKASVSTSCLQANSISL